MTAVFSNPLLAHVGILARAVADAARQSIGYSDDMRRASAMLRRGLEESRAAQAEQIEAERIEGAKATGDRTFGIKSKGRRGARARSQLMMASLGQHR